MESSAMDFDKIEDHKEGTGSSDAHGSSNPSDDEPIGNKNLIPFHLRCETSDDLNFDEFMKKAESEKNVVVSTVEGGGKTTFARKIQENLIKKFPGDKVCCVNVKNRDIVKIFDDPLRIPVYLNELLSGGKNEADLTEKLEKSEVRMILDILFVNLRILKEFEKKSSIKQIFIITSEFFEYKKSGFSNHKDKKSKFEKTLIFQLKNPGDEEQRKFLVDAWGPQNPNLSLDLIDNCSILMVDKIKEINSLNIFGVLLLLERVADIFKSELDENFSKKLENLTILKLFDKKLPPKDGYKYASVIEHFGYSPTFKLHNTDKMLCLDSSVDTIFYVVKCIINRINDPSIALIINEILIYPHHKIIRFFLNELLEYDEYKCKNLCKIMCENKKENFNILFEENLYNLLAIKLHGGENNPAKWQGKGLKTFKNKDWIIKKLLNVSTNDKNEKKFIKIVKFFINDEEVMKHLMVERFLNAELFDCIAQYGSFTTIKFVTEHLHNHSKLLEIFEASQEKFTRISQELIDKICSKCHFSLLNNREHFQKFLKIACKTKEHVLFADVVASYGPIILDLNTESDFLKSFEYRSNLSQHGEEFIYFPVDFENEEFFFFDIVRCAMLILYSNNFLPYFKHHEKERELKRIIKFLRTIELSEVLPKYFATGIDSEINDKISKFFYDFVKPELEIPDGNKIRELNRQFCLLKRLKKPELKLNENYKNSAIEMKNLPKKIFIKSNVPCMVLERIYSQVKFSSCVDAENLFIILNLINLKDIKEYFLEIASSPSIKTIFVDVTDCTEENLNTLKAPNLLVPIIYVGTDESLFECIKMPKIEINFTWNDFSKESQEFLLCKKIEFQHEFFEFREIFPHKHDELSSDFFQDLCSSRSLVINSKEPLEKSDFIERSFLLEKSDGKLYAKDKRPNDENNNGSPTKKPKNEENLIKYSNFIEKTDKNYEKISLENLLNSSNTFFLLKNESETGKTVALKLIKNMYKFCKYVSLDDVDMKENFLDYLNEVEKNIFMNHSAVFILDGVNDSTNSETLKAFLQNFKELNRNKLWIGISGVFNVETVEDLKLNPLHIKLDPITTDQVKDFLKKFLKTDENVTIDTLVGALSREYENPCHYLSVVREVMKNDLPKNLTVKDFCKKFIGNEMTKKLYFPALKYHKKNMDFTSFKLQFFVEDEKTKKYVIKLRNGNFKFASLCLQHFIIADFIENALESFNSISIQEEFIKFLRNILWSEDHGNIRDMLSELKLEKLKTEKCANYMLLFFKEYSEISFNFNENQMNLAIQVIEIFKRSTSCQQTSIKVIAGIICSLLVVFNSENNYGEVLIDTALDVTYFEEILLNFCHDETSRGDDEGLKIFEKIVKLTRKEDLRLKFVKLVLKKFKGNDKAFSVFLNIKVNKIFLIVLDISCARLFKTVVNYIRIERFKECLKLAYDKNYDIDMHEKINILNGKKWTNKENTKQAKNFNTELKKFHEDVDNENVDDVDDFLNKHKNFHWFRVIQHAVAKKKYKSFESLLRCANWNSLSELQQNKIENFQMQMNRNETIENAIAQSSKSIKKILVSKFLESSKSPRLKNIIKIIDGLMSIKGVKEIMTKIAYSDIEIVFGRIDRDGISIVNGLFCAKTMKIFINSIYKDKKQKVIEILAHEGTHGMMFITYNNGGIPHCKSDLYSEELYTKVVEDLQNNIDKVSDQIIRNVFSQYDNDFDHKSEMIVRIPQMRVRDTFKGRKSHDYKPLTDFFENVVLRDLRIIDGGSLAQLNDKFKLWDRIVTMDIYFETKEELNEILMKNSNEQFFLNSKSSILLLRSIINIFFKGSNKSAEFFKLKTSNLFIDVQMLLDGASTIFITEFLKKLKNLLKSETVKRIFLYCDENRQVNEEFLRELYKELEISTCKCNVFFINHNNNYREKLKSKTIDLKLSEKSIKSLKAKKLNFQKKNVEIVAILDESSLTDDFLMKIFLEKKSIINKTLPTSKIIISRHFTSVPDKTTQNIESPLYIDDINPEKLIKMDTKRVLISNIIGSGKSVILQFLYELKVKNNTKNFLLYFVAANDHEEFLINLTEENLHLYDLYNDLREFITLPENPRMKNFFKILKIVSKVEQEIFVQLYETGKVIFFIDEIDKISPTARLNLMKLIEELKEVWMTCRPNLEDKLVQKFNFNKILQLKVLDPFEKTRYLNLVLTNKNLSLKKVENIIEDDSFAFPNLISIISEHYDELDAISKDEVKLWKICEIFLKQFKSQEDLGVENVHTLVALSNHMTEFDYLTKNWSCDDEEINECGLINSKTKEFYQPFIELFLIAKFAINFKRPKPINCNKNFFNYYSNFFKAQESNVLLEKAWKLVENKLVDEQPAMETTQIISNLLKGSPQTLMEFVESFYI